ncbi:MAG TPA: amidohydrolase family protein [Mycobacteriales bacterium]|nr:amidohydrolase family protein [Mycobacteriales bacterium]
MDDRDTAVIDSDIHITLRSLTSLHPYLERRWRDYLIESGTGSLESNLYPKGTSLAAAPEFTPPSGDVPGSDLNTLRTALLDPWKINYGIVNCTYGVPMIHNDDWAAAMARALNDWQLAEWLEPEPRLRGSIIVPLQNADFAVEEIDRLGDDPRFVQILLPARSENPLGKRRYWPMYRAAARHGLAIGIYAGGSTGNPITSAGWPTYYLEDYVDMAQAFQAQVISLVSEGVFSKFPRLRAVLIESGFTWLPSMMWRFDKNWKGLRREVPWVDRFPSEFIHEHIRLSLQPIDAPEDPVQVRQAIDHLGSDDMLLFSTDFPHRQFDTPERATPAGLPPALRQKIMAGNAATTYGLPLTSSVGV